MPPLETRRQRVEKSTNPLWGLGAQFLGELTSSAIGYKSAQEQMDFQKEMSGTAHQREVKDLRAAGLNPILSAMGGSGASTPSGTMFKPSNPAAGAAQLLLANKLAKTTISKNLQDMNTSYEQSQLNSAATHKVNQETLSVKEDIRTKKLAREILGYSVNEAKSSSQLWKDVGEGGKAAKLIMELLRGRK